MKTKKSYIVIGAVLFIFLLAYLTMGQTQYRVEVCVEFQGRSNCRIAAASSQEQAQRTATENACATIASGMTETIACGHATPASVRVLH